MKTILLLLLMTQMGWAAYDPNISTCRISKIDTNGVAHYDCTQPQQYIQQPIKFPAYECHSEWANCIKNPNNPICNKPLGDIGFICTPIEENP